MNKKLLYKTQKAYLTFSIAICLIVAPLFYFLSQKFYIKNTDETLLLYKTEFLQKNAPTLTQNDIAVWNRFNSRIHIKELNGLQKDTLFKTFKFNSEEQENEPYRELNAPITIAGKKYTFSATMSIVESEDLVLNIALLFFGLIALLIIGLFSITKILSVRLWKPFYETLKQIENFEIDKNKVPKLTKTTIEEFNRLNKSISNLIERNIAIYENQREFVENAAHELQTPIAVFKAKIDSLMQRNDITEGQSALLSSLNQSATKLNRLNKNLLLLSKIDKSQFTETQNLSIKEIIENQFEFFMEQSKQKNIKISTNFKSECIVNAHLGLTEILVSNLFLNAIRHNISNGEIQISLFENNLEISNTGENTPLLSTKLFNRFSKSPTSNQGNGLGLAIVKKIADLYNWNVFYKFEGNKHIFSIHFK